MIKRKPVTYRQTTIEQMHEHGVDPAFVAQEVGLNVVRVYENHEVEQQIRARAGGSQKRYDKLRAAEDANLKAGGKSGASLQRRLLGGLFQPRRK